jgi:hypothetical protein
LNVEHFCPTSLLEAVDSPNCGVSKRPIFGSVSIEKHATPLSPIARRTSIPALFIPLTSGQPEQSSAKPIVAELGAASIWRYQNSKFSRPPAGLGCSQGAKLFFRKFFRKKIKMRLLSKIIRQKSAEKLRRFAPYPEGSGKRRNLIKIFIFIYLFKFFCAAQKKCYLCDV